MHGQPVLQVRVKQGELARYGVPARAVLDLIESLAGKPMGTVIEGQIPFPLMLRLPDSYRSAPSAIGALQLTTARGERLPLARLATLDLIEGPAEISREWGQRRVTIQCNVRDRDIGGFVDEARRRVAQQISLPSGGRYRVDWGGQFENMQRRSAG